MGAIALLSDLGNNDTGVARAKGILLQQLPGMPLIDVTHNLYPYYIQQAAYQLASSVNALPADSFHVLLFDIYYDRESKLVLADLNGKKILAPDNGVLPLAFPGEDIPSWLCFSMNDTGNLADWVHAIAGVITQLQTKTAGEAGYTPCSITKAPGQFVPFTTANAIEGHVIHIDNFGNVVLNITKKEFEQASGGRKFSINFIRENVTAISNNYNSVNTFEKLCRFNSSGYLEIAINKGNAAELFGLKMKRPGQLMYTTIKIDFE